MCGREEEQLVRALIEGTELKVCRNCSRFGKILRNVYNAQAPAKSSGKPAVKTQIQPKIEIIELVNADYASIIKQNREKLGLTQEEFARKLNEKQSFLQSIESGKHMPSLELARKLEKMLGIVLIEEHKESHGDMQQREKSSVLTFGDIIKLKKK